MFAVAIIILSTCRSSRLEGVAGKMFVPMALTVILALSGSLIVTMTLMPALAAIFLAGRGVSASARRASSTGCGPPTRRCSRPLSGTPS